MIKVIAEASMTRKEMFMAVTASLLIFGTALVARAQPNPAAPSGTAAAPGGEASSPSASGRFVKIDALLVQLSAAASDMRKFMDGRGSAEPFSAQRCRDNFTAKDLASAVLPRAMEHDVVAFQQCRAYAEKNPRLCDGIGEYKFEGRTGKGLAKNCRVIISIRGVAQSIISHAPDAMDRCAKFTSEQHQGYEAEQRKACALMLAEGANSPGVPKRAAALLPITPEHAVEVAKTLGMLIGDEETCADIRRRIGKGADLDECLSFAAYRKAFAAKDASLCGSSATCRLMMGGAGDCGALVSGSYCGAVAGTEFEARRGKTNQENEKAYRRMKAEDDALLKHLTSKLEGFGPRDDPGLESRKGQFASLRDSLQQADHEFHPR
jgi:hypothetical protein